MRRPAEANDLLRGAVKLETDLMGTELTTLASSDIERFERDGYVVVREAFSPADGRAMERRWWSELEDAHGIGPDDRSSWRPIVGAIRCQLHRFGRAARRRDPGPFRVPPPAAPAGTSASREPAARFDRQAPGTVPPLAPLANGAHRTSAVTCRPDRRVHGHRNHRRRRTPPSSRIDRRGGRHGLLPPRHGPLRRTEPRRR